MKMNGKCIDSRRNDGPAQRNGYRGFEDPQRRRRAVALGTTLEPMDDELFVDGTACIFSPASSDPQVPFQGPGTA